MVFDRLRESLAKTGRALAGRSAPVIGATGTRVFGQTALVFLVILQRNVALMRLRQKGHPLGGGLAFDEPLPAR